MSGEQVLEAIGNIIDAAVIITVICAVAHVIGRRSRG